MTESFKRIAWHSQLDETTMVRLGKKSEHKGGLYGVKAKSVP